MNDKLFILEIHFSHFNFDIVLICTLFVKRSFVHSFASVVNSYCMLLFSMLVMRLSTVITTTVITTTVNNDNSF